MRGAASLALAALLAGGPFPASAAPSSPGDGPLGLETGGTFGRLFLEPLAADARALPGPALDLRWTVASDWSVPLLLARGRERAVVQVDEQSDALDLWLAAPWSWALGRGPGAGEGAPGLWERLSTGLSLRAVEHWGGWTDRPIEAWHWLGRFDGFERRDYPRDRVAVALLGERGGLEVRGPRLTLGDPVVRTRLLLAEWGEAPGAPGRARAGLSASLDVKLPLGRPERLSGSGGWDASAGLLGSVALTPWLTGHALLGATAVSPLPAALPLRPRPWRFTAEVSLVARLGDLAVIVEDRVRTALFGGSWAPLRPWEHATSDVSGYYAAFLPQNRVAVGVRLGAWSVWLSEDWTPGAAPYSTARDNWFFDSNAPDVAFGVAYSRSFGAER